MYNLCIIANSKDSRRLIDLNVAIKKYDLNLKVIGLEIRKLCRKFIACKQKQACILILRTFLNETLKQDMNILLDF